MSAKPAPLARQRGAALILFATILVLGVTWFAASALPKTATMRMDREMKTNQALRKAKEALLGYAAQYAAQPQYDVPGRLPCPESTNAIGTTSEGQASTSCSNTQASIGRLPWRTIGMDQPRDGDGEPLWYVLSPGFRAAPVNFGTPGQLTLDGTSNAVALIIAPGRAVNTQAQAGTPPTGCSAVNQQTDRYASPLDATKFFECGNASGNYVTAGPLPWSNDRVMAVSAAEWADAIAGAVAERLQRELIPMLEYWRSTASQSYWGVSFLPHASTFSDPATNNLCGDMVSGVGVTEGMIPAARATTNCTFWSSPFTISKVTGSSTLSSTSCGATSTAWRCMFTQGAGSLTVRITATAPRITGSFRGRITESDVRVPSPPGTSFTTSNFSLSALSSTGSVSLSVNVALPTRSSSTTTVVEINHLPEPSGTWTETSVRWFMQNNWARYTYYAISPGARAIPGLACDAPGASGCISVNGLPSGSGNADDKRLVLALMGRPIGSQTAPALEEGSHTMPGTAAYTDVPAPFTVSRALTTNNDRLAMCPYRYTAESGSTLIPCN